jgi:hypothetical protein
MMTWWLVLMSRSRSDSATTGLRKRGIPVAGRPVARDDQRPDLPLGDEFVEVIGLGRGQLAHREVVEDEDVGPDEFADPFLPGAVRGVTFCSNFARCRRRWKATVSRGVISSWQRTWRKSR